MTSFGAVARFAICVTFTLLAYGDQWSFAGERVGSTDVPELLVTGERPGPSLWRVSKGTHDLWVLATIVPLPRGMIWRSDEVASRIAASQVVIAPPQLTPDIGLLRGLTLIPVLLQARRSPDRKTLEQSLPHSTYMRWLALRVKYLNHDDEKIRPLLAALDLYSSALERVGLTLDDDEVWDVIERIAKARHVPIEHIKVKVPLDDPRGAIKGLSTIPRAAEIDCFEQTLSRLETEIPSMVHRANLWSTGNIEDLLAMPPSRSLSGCRDALFFVPQLKVQLSNVDASMSAAWLAAADDALQNHASSFAVLALDDLIEPDGLINALRARGYSVEMPNDVQ